jgi:hypothetical protein
MRNLYKDTLNKTSAWKVNLAHEQNVFKMFPAIALALGGKKHVTSSFKMLFP